MLRLGDLLVKNGNLTPSERDLVLHRQQVTGRPFGELAEKLFGVGQSAVEQAWAEQYAMVARRVDPRTEPVEAEVLGLIERRQAWQFRMLPLRFDGDELMVVTTQQHLVKALKFAGWKLEIGCYFVLADPWCLGQALMRYYPIEGMGPGVVEQQRLSY